jgi:hypothetical protein
MAEHTERSPAGGRVAEMTDAAKRERAALDVLALLPDRWALGPTSYDPGTGRWRYTARGPHPGRGRYPETLTGTAEDELTAMMDLRLRLDERHRAEKLAEIDRRGRVASLKGPRRSPTLRRAGRSRRTNYSG